MKAWIVFVGFGVAVVAGTVFIARDLNTKPDSEPAVTEWRPAKQLTVTTAGGGTRSMHLVPDDRAVRQAALGRVAAFDVRWNDARQLALRTPRVQLSGSVKDLQALARESRKLQLSECLEPGREFWSSGLDAEVQTFFAFMAQERNAQERLQKEAAQHLAGWKAIIDACG